MCVCVCRYYTVRLSLRHRREGETWSAAVEARVMHELIGGKSEGVEEGHGRSSSSKAAFRGELYAWTVYVNEGF